MLKAKRVGNLGRLDGLTIRHQQLSRLTAVIFQFPPFPGCEMRPRLSQAMELSKGAWFWIFLVSRQVVFAVLLRHGTRPDVTAVASARLCHASL